MKVIARFFFFFKKSFKHFLSDKNHYFPSNHSMEYHNTKSFLAVWQNDSHSKSTVCKYFCNHLFSCLTVFKLPSHV